MALEPEASLLRAGINAGLLDAQKGNAALVVYSQLREAGASFSFGDFLIDRGLITKMGVEGIQKSLEIGDEQPGTTWEIGDFELLELLGEGERGSVFRASQTSTGRPVALKILSPSLADNPKALQGFLNEARMCARLRHPNIVQFIRVASAKGLYYYAMELMEGGSTRALMDRSGGRIPEQQALKITKQIASALQVAHAAHLIHRDIKPENILLTAQGEGMLGDLGIARYLHGGMGAAEEEDGVFWGTPAYVAPEVITGDNENDPRSDLYSLGATLFEFLTGRPPFVAEKPLEVLRQHVEAEAPDVRSFNRQISAKTAALIKILLKKNPESRFPDAEKVSIALGHLDDIPTQPELPPRPTQPAPRPSARRPHVSLSSRRNANTRTSNASAAGKGRQRSEASQRTAKPISRTRARPGPDSERPPRRRRPDR